MILFSLSLQTSKDSWVIPLPLSVPLKFQVCRNMEELDQTKEFCRLHEKIKNLVDQAKNLIQVSEISFSLSFSLPKYHISIQLKECSTRIDEHQRATEMQTWEKDF